MVKDRSVAILLAVLTSFISWSYTFTRNWPKFWIGLVLSAVGWSLSLHDAAWAILGVAVWIWAIVDNTRKPTEYYLRYPAPWERYRPGSF